MVGDRDDRGGLGLEYFGGRTVEILEGGTCPGWDLICEVSVGSCKPTDSRIFLILLASNGFISSSLHLFWSKSHNSCTSILKCPCLVNSQVQISTSGYGWKISCHFLHDFTVHPKKCSILYPPQALGKTPAVLTRNRSRPAIGGRVLKPRHPRM